MLTHLATLTVVLAAAATLPGCASRARTSAKEAAVSCDGMPKGWVTAKAITPDLVPPCKSGSSGICAAGYRYVSGTGWCRPTSPERDTTGTPHDTASPAPASPGV